MSTSIRPQLSDPHPTPPGRRGPRPTTARGGLVALVLVLAVVGLAGCTSAGGDDADDGAGSAPVVAPRGPGEDARTLSPDAAREAGDAEEPNAADVTFVATMIDHHQQALTMTALAETRAADASVRRLAERIAAAQEPEIAMLEAWLRQHEEVAERHGFGPEDRPAAGHGHGHGHDHAHDHGDGAGGHGEHADMPGMASEEELDRLRAARGAEFDRLFLDLMTVHHEGAVTMATTVVTDGVDGWVAEVAADVAASQGAEIDRMRRLG